MNTLVIHDTFLKGMEVCCAALVCGVQAKCVFVGLVWWAG